MQNMSDYHFVQIRKDLVIILFINNRYANCIHFAVYFEECNRLKVSVLTNSEEKMLNVVPFIGE